MPGSLRPVSDAPRRGIALVRVSKARGREDLISPTLQRTAISDYAARSGIDVTEWVEALDETASRDRSKWWRKLDDAISKVEDGDIDVVLVWKFSRAARHRRRWAIAVDRIEVAGGTLESATEGLDTTTSTGRLARGMLAELAAWESEVKGEQWKETHARRLAMGLPTDGLPRWGYTYERGVGYRPDEKTGPVLADLYRRYIAGESAGALTRWLDVQGHVSTAGNRFKSGHLLRMMDAGFGAGLLHILAEHRWVPGAHEPVITEGEWQAYRLRRGVVRWQPSRTKGSRYPLSGLVFCGLCGAPMYPNTHARGVSYRCERRRREGASGCGNRLPSLPKVERAVLRWLRELVDDVDAAAAAKEAAVVRQVTAEHEGRRLARDIVKLDKALAQLAVDRAMREIPEQAFRDARDELVATRSLVAARLEQAEMRESAPALDFAVYGGLLAEWETIPAVDRRALLAAVIARVEVTAAAELSVVVVPTWPVG